MVRNFTLTILVISAALTASFPLERISINGSPFQRGRQFGTQAKAQILAGIRTLESAVGAPAAALKDKLLYFRDYIDKETLQEIYGLAEGAGIDTLESLLINVWYDLNKLKAGCRQVVVSGSRSTQGSLIHGRNLDWHDFPNHYLTKHMLALNVNPDTGFSYFTLTWPGMLGALQGTNKQGITAAFNQLYMESASGEPVFILMKRVLQFSHSLDEALAIIKTSTCRISGAIVLSSSSEGSACVVEMNRDNKSFRPMAGGSLTEMNTVLNKDMDGIGQSSCPLYKLLPLKIGLAEMQNVLRHRKILSSNNILSVVFHPAQNYAVIRIAGKKAAKKGKPIRLELFP